jgi:hypothetical protein
LASYFPVTDATVFLFSFLLFDVVFTSGDPTLYYRSKEEAAAAAAKDPAS